MHIPKTLLLVAATALMVTPPSAFAKDTDDAAKLREAMRQKLSEAKGAPPAPAPAASKQQAAPAAPAEPAPAPAKPAPAPAPASQPAPAAPASTAAASEFGDSPEDAALREAMRASMANQPQAVVAPAATAAAPAQPAPQSASAKTPAKAAAFAPLQAPPSPLTGSKEERLKQLLDQYKADQITPEEYHKQRAAIVAE